MVSSHSFPGNKTQCKAASATLTHENIHPGNKNSSPSLPSLKKQRAQRSATPPPEPPNGNSRGRPPLPGACRAAGTGRRAAGPSAPDRRAGPIRSAFLRSQDRAGGEREDRRGAAPAASPAQRRPNTPRRPHLRRQPGPGGGAERSAQSYSLGRRGVRGAHRLRAPPAWLSVARCGSRERGGLRSAGNRCRRHRRRGRCRFAGKKQTLAKTSLLNRPCCLPGGETPGPGRPTRHAPGPIGSRTGR